MCMRVLEQMLLGPIQSTFFFSYFFLWCLLQFRWSLFILLEFPEWNHLIKCMNIQKKVFFLQIQKQILFYLLRLQQIRSMPNRLFIYLFTLVCAKDQSNKQSTKVVFRSKQFRWNIYFFSFCWSNFIFFLLLSLPNGILQIIEFIRFHYVRRWKKKPKNLMKSSVYVQRKSMAKANGIYSEP